MCYRLAHVHVHDAFNHLTKLAHDVERTRRKNRFMFGRQRQAVQNIVQIVTMMRIEVSVFVDGPEGLPRDPGSRHDRVERLHVRRLALQHGEAAEGRDRVTDEGTSASIAVTLRPVIRMTSTPSGGPAPWAAPGSATWAASSSCACARGTTPNVSITAATSAGSRWNAKGGLFVRSTE